MALDWQNLYHFDFFLMCKDIAIHTPEGCITDLENGPTYHMSELINGCYDGFDTY
jgi:hypothetical protein